MNDSRNSAFSLVLSNNSVPRDISHEGVQHGQVDFFFPEAVVFHSDSQYSACLRYVSLDCKFLNLKTDKWYLQISVDGGTVWRPVYFKQHAHVSTIQQLLQSLTTVTNAVIGKDMVAYKLDEKVNKVRIELPVNVQMELSADLAVALGYDRQLLLLTSTTAPYVYDLFKAYREVYICLTNVVASTYCGLHLIPLLRNISLSQAAMRHSSHVALSLDDTSFVSVTAANLSHVSCQLLRADFLPVELAADVSFACTLIIDFQQSVSLLNGGL